MDETSSTNTITVRNLQPGTRYTFTVWAVGHAQLTSNNIDCVGSTGTVRYSFTFLHSFLPVCLLAPPLSFLSSLPRTSTPIPSLLSYPLFLPFPFRPPVPHSFPYSFPSPYHFLHICPLPPLLPFLSPLLPRTAKATFHNRTNTTDLSVPPFIRYESSCC